jgi:nucleotide-binding universal stress UspA family protein
MVSRAPSAHGLRSSADRRRTLPPVRIGVGVDGSPSGRDAVVLGSALARAIGAELMLISVYEEPLLEPVVPAEVGWSSARKQARALLADTRDALAPEARIMVDSDALVSRGLARVVGREHRNVVVVGSSRRASDGHVRLGKRVRELMGHLECPLAIAPRGMRTRERPRLDRIGVGYEDETGALAALELARSIALSAGAELAVRAVIDDRTPVGLPDEDLVPVGETILGNQTRLLLYQARAAVGGTDLPVRLEVSCADATDALSDLGGSVDLLVIGSRRSASADRISLGRTGSAVVDEASCSVLLVPRPHDAAAI